MKDGMQNFVYRGQAGKVIFGHGSLTQLGAEIEALGAHKALVLCTPEQRASAERVADLLGVRAAGIFDRAVMHVPIETVRDVRALARQLGADCAVAIGGGSTTGLGKAIALDSGLPILAIPTTYAGSEMTEVYGITENGIKKTGRDPRALPRTVIYDPALTLSLPVSLSVTSGINAIAHAAEGLYCIDSNPVMDLMAREGIAALARSLPLIRRSPTDGAARSDALYGAWLCGLVLNNVGMALHHKLCHTLGGTFNLPHAETHSVVLPHALAYNAPMASQAMAVIAQALSGADSAGAGLQGDGNAAAAVFDLAQDNGAAVSLQALGMKEADLDRACEMALQNQYPNPRPLERVALRQLLQNAFDGRRPD
jgi:maleylacetate reductase